MNHMDSTETRECRTLAKTMCDDYWARKNVVWYQPLQNRLNNKSINVGSLGDAPDPHFIEGRFSYGNAIVKLPKLTSQTDRIQFERAVYGAIVHECTHIIQSQVAPKDVQNALDILNNHDPNHTDVHHHLEFYYGLEVEIDAHAAQAAAEVEYVIGHGGTEEKFMVEVINTPVYFRISSRLPTNSSEEKVTDWWDKWLSRAFEIYDTVYP
jgi:hypothetical protein